MGYGYYDGHPWLLVSPLAVKGTYEGQAVYRNKVIEKWFPTRVVVASDNTFTSKIRKRRSFN